MGTEAAREGLAKPEKLVVFPDSPCSSDVFDRQAKTIGDIILNADADAGFTIGLLGPWGSGKTSVLRNIETYLTATDDADGSSDENPAKKKILGKKEPLDEETLAKKKMLAKKEALAVARFEAWRYSDSPELMAGLLDTVAESLKRGKFEERLEKLASVASRLASLAFAVAGKMAPIDTGILNAAKEVLNDKPEGTNTDSKRPIKQLYYQTLDEIAEELEKEDPKGKDAPKRKIVVLVDDLDRCTPETVANLLEGVNTLVGCKRFFFVLAFDRDYLVDVINQKYRPKNDTDDVNFSDRFMEKLIQIPVQIPTLNTTVEYSQGKRRVLEQVIGDDGVKQLEKFGVDYKLREHLERDIIPLALGSNPRQIKRYLNMYLLSAYMTWDDSFEKWSGPRKTLLDVLGLRFADIDFYRNLADLLRNLSRRNIPLKKHQLSEYVRSERGEAGVENAGFMPDRIDPPRDQSAIAYLETLGDPKMDSLREAYDRVSPNENAAEDLRQADAAVMDERQQALFDKFYAEIERMVATRKSEDDIMLDRNRLSERTDIFVRVEDMARYRSVLFSTSVELAGNGSPIIRVFVDPEMSLTAQKCLGYLKEGVKTAATERLTDISEIDHPGRPGAKLEIKITDEQFDGDGHFGPSLMFNSGDVKIIGECCSMAIEDARMYLQRNAQREKLRNA